MFETLETRSFTDTHIRGVHDADFIDYLARACEEVAADKSLYPYVFPIRNKTRPPRESTVLPGYYCIDTFTPIHRNAWPAARAGVDAVLTAADTLLEGRRVAYALVRPPGHHAEQRSFGGFCYLNNAAIAARYLREQGRVAILDIDYHHGNGQQDIFTTGQISSPYPSTATLRLPILISPDFQMKPAQAKAKVSISICPWTKPWTAKPSERL